LFSVLVMHWVTHQDDEENGSKSHCQGCNRTIGESISHGSAFTSEPGARIRVTTRIEAGLGKSAISKSIPLGGILTHTEISRDVENIGAPEVDYGRDRDRHHSIDFMHGHEDYS
ncbi:hypothetical protein Q9L58_003842, partial [Maublancomyces gigas]